LQKIYDNKSFIGRLLKVFLGFCLSSFSSHSVLLVFKKRK